MAKTTTKAAPPEARVVYLGNHDAVEVFDDPADVAAAAAEERAPRKTRVPLPAKKRATTVVVPAWSQEPTDDEPGVPMKLGEAFATVSHMSLWDAHSDAEVPKWVASTDPLLGQLLADHWGCELRDPDPEA